MYLSSFTHTAQYSHGFPELQLEGLSAVPRTVFSNARSAGTRVFYFWETVAGRFSVAVERALGTR